MKKLTFEKAVLIVFIVIILISTSDITGKYMDIAANQIGQWFKEENTPPTTDEPGQNLGFPTMLVTADNLYKAGDYSGAANEYLAIILKSTLSPEQKVYAYFRLGICHYNLSHYDLAAESFSKIADFNPDDSVAYNNAAVSAYKSKDMKKAIELQRKALDILPAVEYYYNLARMYEDNAEYRLAVDNYQFVAIGEKNLTAVEKIDPVRVKEKIARLTPTNSTSVSEAVNNILRVYRLDDHRELLTINENEMQLKEGDFIVKVDNQKTSKSIVAEYDRVKFDPYNLISELVWTVYKDGKAVYKKTSDKIKFATTAAGNYEVKLNIKYNGNSQKVAAKTIRITETQSTIDHGTVGEVAIVTPPIAKDEKVYSDAIYEQVFDSNFKISGQGYADKYNVVWGIDNEIVAGINNKSYMDKSASLSIENQSDIDKGMWVNLDNYIREKNVKGKNIVLSFSARKLSSRATISMLVRTKTDIRIVTIQELYPLNDTWTRYVYSTYIPDNASGLTISIQTRPNEEFLIDSFTIKD